MERDAHDGALLECPWVPVCISGSQLLAKTWFGNTAYRVLLTDTHCVWEEEMDTTAIQDRAQELNKRLRAPVHAFFSHLCEMVRPCLAGRADEGVQDESSAATAQLSLTHQGTDIRMKLKSELAGVPFYWEFRCTPAPVTLVCNQLVRPLLLMSRLLQRQVEQLGAMLARKDTEIQDYRENGAVLSRERLQTEMFDEQSFRENVMTQALPQVCVRQDGLGFDSELQELYTAVTGHGTASARKRKSSDRHAPEEDNAPSPQPPDDLSHEPGQGEKNQTGPEGDRAGTMEPERPSEQQTSPRKAAASDRPSSRPRKKKAVGLFR